jgi:hypothetical protein
MGFAALAETLDRYADLPDVSSLAPAFRDKADLDGIARDVRRVDQAMLALRLQFGNYEAALNSIIANEFDHLSYEEAKKFVDSIEDLNRSRKEWRERMDASFNAEMTSVMPLVEAIPKYARKQIRKHLKIMADARTRTATRSVQLEHTVAGICEELRSRLEVRAAEKARAERTKHDALFERSIARFPVITDYLAR